MNKRLTQFLASARACSLSPIEHAQARAEIAAHMATAKAAPSLLHESAESLRLTADEKAVGRSRLLHFMRTHPPEEPRVPLLGRFLKRFASASIASAVTVTLAGGGIALAAENALPGDVLYPVKIHIMEPIRTSLSSTPVARAQWNVRQIERRLLESAAANEQPYEQERQVVLHSQMEKNISNLQEHLNALPSEDQRMIRRDLLLELTEHQPSLRHIQNSTGIPSALKTLAEDAADEREKSRQQEPERGNSESERGKEGERGDRREKSFESSLASSSASSEEKTREIPVEKETKKEGNRREEPEETVESLLKLLREASSSSSSDRSSFQSEDSHPSEEQDLLPLPSLGAQSSQSRGEKEEREKDAKEQDNREQESDR